MRILYAITQGEQGGASHYVAALALAAKEAKNDVTVAIGEQGDGFLTKRLESTGIETIQLKRLKRAINPFQDCLAVLEFVRLTRRLKPEIIHLNSTKAGIIGSLASLMFVGLDITPKIIYTAHGWVFNEPMPWLLKQLYKSLEKLTAGRKNKIICVSEYDRWVALAEKIARPNKLITIRNGIDANTARFLSKQEARQLLLPGKDIAANATIIGTIANFYPTKGLKYLIEALSIATKSPNIDILAVIIGDGLRRAELEQQIKQSGLESRIILAGRLPDAGKYLKAFDLTVLSSVKEGLPYFLLEAMSAELPIIATKVGGVPEIIVDQETGLTVEPKDPIALAAGIVALCQDKALAAKLGQAALKKVEKEFTQRSMIEKTLACYT